MGESVFETIPEELILKAALVAAAQLLEPTSDGLSSQSECVSGKPKCCEESR